MKALLVISSIAGLALTVVPAVLVFTQTILLSTDKQLMFFGMLIWFFTAPLWMKEQKL